MPSGFICWSCYETKVFKYSENSPIRVLTPDLRAARRSIPNFCSKMKCLNTAKPIFRTKLAACVITWVFWEGSRWMGRSLALTKYFWLAFLGKKSWEEDLEVWCNLARHPSAKASWFRMQILKRNLNWICKDAQAIKCCYIITNSTSAWFLLDFRNTFSSWHVRGVVVQNGAFNFVFVSPVMLFTWVRASAGWKNCKGMKKCGPALGRDECM